MARPKAWDFGSAQARHSPFISVPGLACPAYRVRAWAANPARRAARPATMLASWPANDPHITTSCINNHNTSQNPNPIHPTATQDSTPLPPRNPSSHRLSHPQPAASLPISTPPPPTADAPLLTSPYPLLQSSTASSCNAHVFSSK
jgi:hypothetical protein